MPFDFTSAGGRKFNPVSYQVIPDEELNKITPRTPPVPKLPAPRMLPAHEIYKPKPANLPKNWLDMTQEADPSTYEGNISKAFNYGASKQSVIGGAIDKVAPMDSRRVKAPETFGEKAAAMVAANVVDLPLWLGGEKVVTTLGTKLLPKAIQTATPAIVGRAAKNAGTWAGVVAPAQTLVEGSGMPGYTEKLKETPAIVIGGEIAHGVGKGLGKLPGTFKDFVSSKYGKPVEQLAPEQQAKALAEWQDVVDAYKSPTLRDVKQQEYEQLFSNPRINANTAPVRHTSLQQEINENLIRPPLAEGPRVARQSDLEAVFGRNTPKQYAFTTGEQRALNELQQGVETAQNYLGHNDIYAAYPPGTPKETIFADIKANTGVDLPTLTANLERAQSLKTSLTPSERQLGRAAGVVPNLRPREMLTSTPELPQPLPPRIVPEQPTPRMWTNREGIPIEPPTPPQVTPPRIQPPQPPSIGRNIEPPQLGNAQAAATAEPKSFQIVSSVSKNKPGITNKLQSIYRETVNNTQGINRTVKGTGLTGAENAAVMATNARNAGGTVSHIVNHGLVDMSGKTVVDKSVMDAFKLPKEQQGVLDEYLYHLHNIDRMKEGKPLDSGISVEQSKQAIAKLEQEFPDLNLKERAATVRQTLDGLLNEWGVKSGLVSSELRDTLQNMYKNYVPSYRQLSGVDAVKYKTRSTGPAKLINNAVGGDEPLISLRESIPMLINKTIKAARKNEVYRGILEAARANPENGFARVLGEDSKAAASLENSVKNDGLEGIVSSTDKALEADPKLGYLLTAMENGKPVKVQINKELFDSLNALNKVDDTSLNRVLQGFKKYGTNWFKSLITGYNPIFAVRNVARDIPTAYIQGTENNPFKFVRNLGVAGKDMVTRSPRFKEYKALGGEGGNFFNVERGLKPTGPLRKAGNAIGAINNFTETLPRYGEYIGTLKRGGEGYSNKMQALHNAAEVTTNFGRHGDLTKSVDAVVPYLNPTVQGIDKFARSMTKPVNIAKAVGVTTVPTAAFYAMNQAVDKQGYDQLDNRTKDTYYLVPQGDGKFIKIPKTREAGVLFGALFERLARLKEGQQGSFKGFGNTVATNFWPNGPVENNIFSPLIYNLPMNKDFAGRNIVPSYMINDQRSPRLQYDEQTSQIAKTIGDKFNLSPKQIDYLIKSYGGIVAQIAQPATTSGGQPISNILSRNFTADATYNNDILNNFYGKMDSLRQTATDKNLTQDIPSKVVTSEEKQYNDMLRISKEISEIRKKQLQAQVEGKLDDADYYRKQILRRALEATK